MKKIFFAFLAVLFLLTVIVLTPTSKILAYCPPGQVRIINPAPANTGAECMKKIKQIFNRGETNTVTAHLKKGEIYRASASGCPRAGNIKLKVIKGDKQYAISQSEYSPHLCFTAPEEGNYNFIVTLETTLQGSSWGNVDSCFYKSQNCD